MVQGAYRTVRSTCMGDTDELSWGVDSSGMLAPIEKRLSDRLNGRHAIEHTVGSRNERIQFTAFDLLVHRPVRLDPSHPRLVPALECQGRGNRRRR